MSVAVWINDPSRGAERANAIAAFGDGNVFGFESMPLERTTKAQADAVRQAGLRVNGNYVATGDASGDAERIRIARSAIGANLVDIDCEVHDSKLKDYMRNVVLALRAGKPHVPFPVRLTVAPHKSVFLPMDLFDLDTNLWAAVETYYGNMQGRYSEASALWELISGAGIPRGQCSVIYAAMCDVLDPFDKKWKRMFTLPSLFEDGTLVDHLAGGPVYDDDLMAEAGFWA